MSQNIYGQDIKIDDRGNGLLNAIFSSWKDGHLAPLFVSEGTQQQKLLAIHNSPYLSTVYREVLPSTKTNLTIYGWGFGNQDIHLLKQMSNSGIQNVAVSVYNNDQVYCNNVYNIVKQNLGDYVNVEFFDSLSADCWNN